MIYITSETTPEDIVEDLTNDGCTVNDLVDLIEFLEKKADRLENNYPSNYPRPHLDEAIKSHRRKALVIREALERF